MKKQSNVFAILGFIFSLVVSSVLGLIFSILGISESKKNGGYLKGLAVAGLIISILRMVATVLLVFILAFVIMHETDTDYKCNLAYDCVKGLFGNYECKYNGDTFKTTITCSKDQINKKSKEDDKAKVEIVVFYGSGCSHCADLFDYLTDLKDDPVYGKMFTIKKYETWQNAANAALMEKTFNYYGVTDPKLMGVPLFIIGDKHFTGFPNPSTMTQEYDTELKTALSNAYYNGYTKLSFID